MAEITVINGTGGNDVIQPNRGDAYQDGKLVFMVAGSPADGVMPLVNILVNGVVAIANVPVTALYYAGQTQLISWTLPPAGFVVNSVGIQYVNDLSRTVDDRNLFVLSATLNGTLLPLSSGTYFPVDRPVVPGGVEIPWNGPLLFSGDMVRNAAASDSFAGSVTIDGLGGVDTAIYQGRASSYDVGFGQGITISSKAGFFGPDSLHGVERVLFDDTAYGSGGPSSVSLSGAQRIVDGGAGIDSFAYLGARADYTIARTAAGNYTVNHNANQEGFEVLVNVERLIFNDARVALDVNGNGGMAYRLYQAAFDRAPDLGGLGYQMNALDNGLYIALVAAHFIASPEFSATYGSLSTEQFVTQLYQNVLHRAPDAGGLAYHVNNLNTTHTRADVLVGFSESPENQAALIGTIQNGMLYTL